MDVVIARPLGTRRIQAPKNKQTPNVKEKKKEKKKKIKANPWGLLPLRICYIPEGCSSTPILFNQIPSITYDVQPPQNLPNKEKKEKEGSWEQARA